MDDAGFSPGRLEGYRINRMDNFRDQRIDIMKEIEGLGKINRIMELVTLLGPSQYIPVHLLCDDMGVSNAVFRDILARANQSGWEFEWHDTLPRRVRLSKSSWLRSKEYSQL